MTATILIFVLYYVLTDVGAWFHYFTRLVDYHNNCYDDNYNNNNDNYNNNNNMVD